VSERGIEGRAERAAGSAGKRRAILGLALVAVFWPANWLLPGMRTHLLFFPLWLGYVLAVDGLGEMRNGTSLLSRSRRRFVALFFLSIPVWWFFELMNDRLGNWEYVGSDVFGPIEYALLCSVSFSTVMPAVLCTAELVRGFAWIERFAHGPVVRATPGLLLGLAGTGVGFFVAMLVWPRAFYPFLWISGVLLLEPLCRWIGRRSLMADLERGDWRPWMSLWTGVLVCGICWELWNFWSYPKWVYHVPGVGFLHVFEMPLLGYLGYLPFALQLFLVAELALPGTARLRTAPASRPAARAGGA